MVPRPDPGDAHPATDALALLRPLAGESVYRQSAVSASRRWMSPRITLYEKAPIKATTPM